MATDFLPAVVIDCGSGRVKAGFAGEEAPTVVCPNLVGVPRDRAGARMITASVEAPRYVGAEAQERRGALSLSYPMANGIVQDWDGMEGVLRHVYDRELRVASEERPLLLTEPPLNPHANRERMATLAFETLGVPAAYVSMQAVLSLYSVGRTSGMVIDSGDGVTHAVPVYEGYAMPHAISRMDIAGRDVTQYLGRLVTETERGAAIGTSSSRQEILRDMKEKLCHVRPSAAAVPPAKASVYELPDGSTLELGDQAWRATECLFDPSVLGRENDGGMAGLAVRCIEACDVDARRTLYEGILLSGGTTLLPGMGERLVEEIRGRSASRVATAKTRVSAPPERGFSVWIGGSVLASLQSFAGSWVTAEEYREYGPSVLQRKCF